MIRFSDGDTEKSPLLDLTSLIDIVFLLLIFFLLTSIITSPSIEIELPRAEAAQELDAEDIEISIQSDQSIFLGDDPVELEELGPRLSRLLDSSQGGPVVISADRQLSHGFIIRILSIVQQSGARELAFKVESP